MDRRPNIKMAEYSGFVGMYNFKGNLGKGHYSVVKLAEVRNKSASISKYVAEWSAVCCVLCARAFVLIRTKSRK